MVLGYYDQGCHGFLKGVEICYEEFMIWHQRVKRCDKDEKPFQFFPDFWPSQRNTMSCTYRAEPVINENWSLLTPLQQRWYCWCRQHFSCKMTIQSMFFSINDKQPFRSPLVALKLMGKMTSKCLPFFQYFMPFHYCKTIKDSIQLNFCNLTKEEN